MADQTNEIRSFQLIENKSHTALRQMTTEKQCQCSTGTSGRRKVMMITEAARIGAMFVAGEHQRYPCVSHKICRSSPPRRRRFSMLS
jgi:hypothetical protein